MMMLQPLLPSRIAGAVPIAHAARSDEAIATLAAVSPGAERAGWDVTGALIAALIAAVFRHLPEITQLLALAVVLVTLWEKPTVQAVVSRFRRRTEEQTDDAG